jgi:pilus assembly protein CpaB
LTGERHHREVPANGAGQRMVMRMKAARVVVLGIALAAGGAAAYLVSSGDDTPKPAPAAAPVAQLNTTEVLVAGSDIGIGQGVSPQVLRWQVWPSDAASSGNFIRKSERPNAMEQLSGSITRASFSAGEPIREDKLIRANGSGYLAAVLPGGMRAFSAPISPETGAGGFILPNDRVDVLLIRAQKTASSESYSSETVLSNVRVLAIDQTVEEKNGQRVVVGKIATLALNPRDAETLALATRLGTIALALRSLVDSQDDNADQDRRANLGARESINVVRYGQINQMLK